MLSGYSSTCTEMGKRTAKSIHLTGQGGRRDTMKIKDIESITENCFAYLPLAFSFCVMCLIYIEGVQVLV